MININPAILINTIYEKMSEEDANEFLKKLNINMDDLLEDILLDKYVKQLSKDTKIKFINYTISSPDIDIIDILEIVEVLATDDTIDIDSIYNSYKEILNIKALKETKPNRIKQIIDSELVNSDDSVFKSGDYGPVIWTWENINYSDSILSKETIVSLIDLYAKENNYWRHKYRIDCTEQDYFKDPRDVGYFISDSTRCSIDTARDFFFEKIWTSEMEDWWKENLTTNSEESISWDKLAPFLIKFNIIELVK